MEQIFIRNREIATKEYVDAVAQGGGSSADLSNYYTKAEVDALIAALREEFLTVNTQLENIINGDE